VLRFLSSTGLLVARNRRSHAATLEKWPGYQGFRCGMLCGMSSGNLTDRPNMPPLMVLLLGTRLLQMIGPGA
jgi:hypothetical protein